MSTTTRQVNFRDASSDPIGFISSDMLDDDIFKIFLADLKKEILVGHQAILERKTTSLSEVRKELNLV